MVAGLDVMRVLGISEWDLPLSALDLAMAVPYRLSVRRRSVTRGHRE
jgi:hypothetical protein